MFTPNLSGTWTFRTSDVTSPSDTPVLLVGRMGDGDDVYDFGGAGDNNSILTLSLDEGTTYRIGIELSNRNQSCALHVLFAE